jgi:hypothetical protein
LVKEKVIGVLGAQSERLDAFDKTDLQSFNLANQAGAAIENAGFPGRAAPGRTIPGDRRGRANCFCIQNRDLLEQMAHLIKVLQL